MINRRIAISAMSIVGALAIMGGATFAFFTDTAQSTGNTFSSGNADLQIAPDNNGAPGTFTQNLSDAFNVANIMPGYDESHLFWLKNASASNISLDLLTDVSNYSAPNNPDLALADNLLVSWRCDTNQNNSLDEAYTAEFSVKQWFDGGNAALGTITHNDEMFCEMRTRVLSSVDSSVANGTVDFDVKFDGTQLP